jgi:N-acetylglutamate synthase-like GNAT family acetyltransferase
MKSLDQATTGSNKRWDILLTLSGIAGLVLFLALYDRAFPSAALDLELPRRQIEQRAAEYMSQLGHDLGDHKSALTFHQAWMASVYLQHSLGIPRTNELARTENLPLWFWEVRWFRPLQKEEFNLTLMPDGTVVAMSHVLLEDAPGLDLSQDEARTLAETYLIDDRGWDLGEWEPVTASTQAQPGGRSDHHFEWRRMDWDVGDSELRTAIDVQGDRVDGYGYWLKVPEAFQRHYSEQRNRAGFINNLSYYLGMGGFGLVALLYYFLGHRRGIFAWQEGLRAGVLVGGVYLLAALNFLPLSKAWYGTTQDYAVFWINQLIGILINALLTAGVVMILWAGGLHLARKVWPRQDKLLPRGDDRLITLGRSTWRGLMVGCISGGYVVLFYLVATHVLGGWTPLGAPEVEPYATPLPFLGPLVAGVVPAISEEFLVRLVGIGALLALTRRRWLAVAIPGILWAFAHLSYVRDPIYLRGVELTVVALLYGFILLRFDLTTTLVAHLAYNAGLGALPLLRSGQPYFVANGALIVAVLLAPVLLGAVRWLLRRLRAAPPPAPPAIRPATAQDIPALSRLALADVDWPAWLEDEAGAVLCLRTSTETIGLAAGRVEPSGTGRIAFLYVSPAWRRRYWGSRLVEALSDELRACGARSVEVAAPSDAWTLARFWDAQGWQASATTYSNPLRPSSPRRT